MTAPRASIVELSSASRAAVFYFGFGFRYAG